MPFCAVRTIWGGSEAQAAFLYEKKYVKFFQKGATKPGGLRDIGRRERETKTGGKKNLEDEAIVALYWERKENAIGETEKKYGRYLMKTAYRILADEEDSKESVNDTYWKAWNSMPPHKPKSLATYLGKITRQVSIDRFRKRTCAKRKGSVYALSLSELEECVSAGDSTTQDVDLHLLAEAIQQYLHTLPSPMRHLFIGRYYFMDPIREIAAYSGMSEAKVKSGLHRVRLGLKQYLEQEGFLDESGDDQ